MGKFLETVFGMNGQVEVLKKLGPQRVVPLTLLYS